jgi:Meiotically up-regulated gene 113
MSWAIYVIGTNDGPKKIGVSQKVEERLASINEGSPISHEVLSTIEAVDRAEAFTVEKVTHRLLASDRLRGEWFNVTLLCAEQAIRQAIDHERNNVALPKLRGLPGTRKGKGNGTTFDPGIKRGHAQMKGGNLLSRYKYHGERSPECVEAYRAYVREATRRHRARKKAAQANAAPPTPGS